MSQTSISQKASRKRCKKLYDDDTEEEKRVATQLGLTNQRWLFFSGNDTVLLSINSLCWTTDTNLNEKSDLKKGDAVNLLLDGKNVLCNFLMQGNFKQMKKWEKTVKNHLNNHGSEGIYDLFGQETSVAHEKPKTGSQTVKNAAEWSPHTSATVEPTNQSQKAVTPTLGPLGASPVIESATAAKKPKVAKAALSNCQEFEDFMRRHKERMKSVLESLTSQEKGFSNSRDYCASRVERSISELKEYFTLVLEGFKSIDEFPAITGYNDPVRHADNNLMDTVAGPKPSLLGRDLRKLIWGPDGLTTEMIDPNSRSNRSQVTDVDRKKFKKVVEQKYPLTPQLAFFVAKDAANQAGRESNRQSSSQGSASSVESIQAVNE